MKRSAEVKGCGLLCPGSPAWWERMLSGRDSAGGEGKKGGKEMKEEKWGREVRERRKVFNYFDALALGQAFIRLNAPPDTKSAPERGLTHNPRKSWGFMEWIEGVPDAPLQTIDPQPTYPTPCRTSGREGSWKWCWAMEEEVDRDAGSVRGGGGREGKKRRAEMGIWGDGRGDGEGWEGEKEAARNVILPSGFSAQMPWLVRKARLQWKRERLGNNCIMKEWREV